MTGNTDTTTDDTAGAGGGTDGTGRAGGRPSRPGMRTVRLDALGRMTRLGATGTGSVERRLRDLTPGIEVVGERTTAGFVDERSLKAAFGSDDRVGVRVRITGASSGYVVVLFPLDSADRAATLMLSTGIDDLSTVPNALAHDAFAELGGLVANAFADGIAGEVDEAIDARAPKLISDSERTLIRRTLGQHAGLGLFVTARLRLPDHDVTCDIFLFPESGPFLDALPPGSGDDTADTVGRGGRGDRGDGNGGGNGTGNGSNGRDGGDGSAVGSA